MNINHKQKKMLKQKQKKHKRLHNSKHMKLKQSQMKNVQQHKPTQENKKKRQRGGVGVRGVVDAQHVVVARVAASVVVDVRRGRGEARRWPRSPVCTAASSRPRPRWPSTRCRPRPAGSLHT